jgi:hypothetical protein
MHDQADEERDQEDKEQQLSDTSEGNRCTGKAKQGRNQANYQENQGVVEHFVEPPAQCYAGWLPERLIEPRP